MSGHHGSEDHNHGGHIHESGEGFKFLMVILLNAIITAAEFIGGVLSGSLALISDAGHNLSDVLSLVLGYAGEKISRGKRTELYTFGMKRFEVFIASVNALTLVLIGLYIFYEAVERFRNPVPVEFSIMLPVALVGLAGNVISMLFLGHGEDKSINFRAAFLHMLFDAVSSVAVIIAAVIIYFTSNYWVDIVISFFIAVMIIWSSFGILREAFRIFLQGVPGNIDSAEVYEEILKISRVESLHGLHIWSINSKEVFLSCHICLDAGSEGFSDETIIKINSMLEERFMIEHTTIQVESVNFCGEHNGVCCSH